MNRPSVISSIKEALNRVSPDLQIILYKSEARGDARPDSDIDLLLLYPFGNWIINIIDVFLQLNLS